MSAAVEAPSPPVDAPLVTEPARRDHFHDGSWAAGVSGLAVVLALLLYEVWNANLHLPIGANYDVTGVATLVKGMGQNGWWIHNPQLGAPFGLDLRDFPASGQTSQLLVLRAIVAVVHSPGETVNIYYFGGFAALAAVSFLVFRRFGLSRPVAAALALAYDFLPFHYWHGADHLTHSTYFAAPLGVLLIVRVLEPQVRVLRDQDRPVHRPYFGPEGSVRLGPLLALLGIAVVIGSTDEMFSCFTIVILMIGALFAAIATRRVSRLALAALLSATMLVTFLLLSLPTILHVIQAGKNPVAGQRYAFESDLYGLRPALMLLPTPNHWIPALQKYAYRVLRYNPASSEGGQAIGFIGAIGVLTAIGLLFTRALRPQSPSRERRAPQPLSPLTMPLVVVIVLGILLGAGGATFLDALTNFVQVRTWNQIVVMIAFAAFTLTGFGADRLLARAHARTDDRNAQRAMSIVLVFAIVGIGILDGGRPSQPNPAEITNRATSDRQFVTAMHTKQPADGMIFEFPVMAYPEPLRPIAEMQSYEQFRGYLADSGKFRWSYGAMKGRPQGDWQARLPAVPTESDLRALLGLGFTGIWVNRDGYDDHGKYFESSVAPLLGKPDLVSRLSDLSFYDLRPFAADIKPGTDLAAAARQQLGIGPPAS